MTPAIEHTIPSKPFERIEPFPKPVKSPGSSDHESHISLPERPFQESPANNRPATNRADNSLA
jgi:hypothetical protein